MYSSELQAVLGSVTTRNPELHGPTVEGGTKSQMWDPKSVTERYKVS